MSWMYWRGSFGLKEEWVMPNSLGQLLVLK